MTDKEKSSDEAEIRSLIDAFREAFRAKDVDGIMAFFAPEIVSFDLVPPLQCAGAEQFRRHWEKTFSSHEGSIEYEIHDLNVAVNGDVAFSHSLNRKSGTLANGKKVAQWLRWTACFRKRGDKWLITHEHVSVPSDVESGKALFDLAPSDKI